jgi:ketose-bisphosphate aldolase
MPLVPFQQLMASAESGGYAVGYFESWNLESLQGVIDAAEDVDSPVIVGFSGLNLPDPRRHATERLELYAALGRAACASTRVPVALLFNESPSSTWIEQAIELGFNVVMFADEHLPERELRRQVQRTVAVAAGKAAVEAEMAALPGVASGLDDAPSSIALTDAVKAAEFVAQTGVDALAVALGNIHLHGRRKLLLNLDRLQAIRERVHVPLVLHGASSVDDEALRQAIRGGIRKVNIGSALRSAFYGAVHARVVSLGTVFNPYEVLGSGLEGDILLAGRLAVRDLVREKMQIFGSAGRARSRLALQPRVPGC